MSIYPTAALALVVAIVIATVSFNRPHGVLLRSAIAAACALALPYVGALVLDPFLGSGAGMGVALMLYVLSAAILLAAISAALGAGVRYGWTALNGPGD